VSSVVFLNTWMVSYRRRRRGYRKRPRRTWRQRRTYRRRSYRRGRRYGGRSRYDRVLLVKEHRWADLEIDPSTDDWVKIPSPDETVKAEFKLTNINNAQLEAYQELYRKYKIIGVAWKIMPNYPTGGAFVYDGQGAVVDYRVPNLTLHRIFDNTDGHIPDSRTLMENCSSYKNYRMSSRGVRGYSRVWFANRVYESDLQDAFTAQRGWLDTTSDQNVPHYGPKMAIEIPPSDTAVAVNGYQICWTFYIAFKMQY